MQTTRFIFIVLLALTTSVHTAQGQYDEKARGILDEMSEKYQQMNTYESDIRYTLNNPAASLSEEFKGEITVQGNKFRLLLGDQEIISDGETTWTYLREVNEVNVDDYRPNEGDLSPSKIYDAYKRGFKYVYLKEDEVNGQAVHVIDLLPENDNNQFYRIRLYIGQNNRMLEKWEVYDRSGSTFTYFLDNFNPDVTVPDDYFTFKEKDHKGVEVIDLRENPR